MGLLAKEKLENKYNVKVLAITGDGSIGAEVKNIINKTISEFGKID